MLIGAGLRLEGGFDRHKRSPKPAQHLFQHGIAADAQPVAADLHIGMAIANVPGETRKLWRARGADLDQRLALAGNPNDRAVFKQKAIAIAQRSCVRKIEQEGSAALAGEDNAAAVALVGIEHDTIYDASFGELTGSTHGGRPAQNLIQAQPSCNDGAKT
jgi:hypothetical protein